MLEILNEKNHWIVTKIPLLGNFCSTQLQARQEITCTQIYSPIPNLQAKRNFVTG